MASIINKTFNKKAANLWHVIHIVQKELIRSMAKDKLFLSDGFPISICHYARAHRSTLFKRETAFSHSVAKKERYYGFKALFVTTAS